MYDIVALGEALIDFTPSGINDAGMRLYSQNPGGAPANVLAMASKFGVCTAFIGQVGDDPFGHFLQRSIDAAGISTSGILFSKKYQTSLAFVSLDDKGNRSFSFYRDKGADVMLSFEDIDKDILDSCGIFHFGSVSMTGEPARTATIKSAELAKSNGAIISFDPNYRPFLWKSGDEAVKVVSEVLPLVDILKVSEEEMSLLTGTGDVDCGSSALMERGPKIVIVTMGAEGAFIRIGDMTGCFKTFDVATMDTTGAGDAFLGTFLAKIVQTAGGIDGLDDASINDLMVFSNAAGSLTTTKKGAIPAMPSVDEILRCIECVPLLDD